MPWMPSRASPTGASRGIPSGRSTRRAASLNHGSGPSAPRSSEPHGRITCELAHPPVELSGKRLGRSHREPGVRQTALPGRARRSLGRLAHPGGIRVDTQEGLVGSGSRCGQHRPRHRRCPDRPSVAGLPSQSGELADVHLETPTTDHALHRGMVRPRHCTPPPDDGLVQHDLGAVQLGERDAHLHARPRADLEGDDRAPRPSRPPRRPRDRSSPPRRSRSTPSGSAHPGRPGCGPRGRR